MTKKQIECAASALAASYEASGVEGYSDAVKQLMQFMNTLYEFCMVKDWKQIDKYYQKISARAFEIIAENE